MYVYTLTFLIPIPISHYPHTSLLGPSLDHPPSGC